MSLYQWLLALHVTGGFLVVGGTVAAGVLRVLAQRAQRPSDIALFLKLIRTTLAPIGIGMLVTLVLGLWLVGERDYSWGAAWISLSLLLWIFANALGGIGGRGERHVRELAERLAAEGDAPSDELRARLADPRALGLSIASGLAILVTLGLMIWKPGS
jgi:uncharacterized membrane protein